MIIKVLGTKAETSKPTKKYLGKYHPSILIKHANTTLMVDVGDDILEKTLEEELLSLDFILITHGHDDAIGGMYKLNQFLEKNNKIVTVYLLKQVFNRIKERWNIKNWIGFNFQEIKSNKTYNIGGLSIRVLKVFHDKRFPTIAFNFEDVFLYAPDMGPIFDEYNIKYFSNNILAIIDGAYWNHQIPLNNHIAVLKHFDYLVSLNNKYLLFTGMGNQYPPLCEADNILEEKLKEYKKEHKDCKTKVVRTAREGEKFDIDLNKYYIIYRKDELILKPGFDEILNDPSILHNISNKELVSLHLRCHQLWGLLSRKDLRNKSIETKAITKDKILKVHVLVVKEMLKRGLNHNLVNDLDKLTYRILGKEIKVYEIWNELEDEITIKSDIVKFVGSVLYKPDPNDVDIVAPRELEKILRKYLEKYNPHFIGNVASHGEILSVYDLILKKKKVPIIKTIAVPDYNRKYSICKINKNLNMNSKKFIVEPYINGDFYLVVDKENRVIYEKIITKNNKEIITDLLAYKKDSFLSEILINRIFFMGKKWLDKLDKPKLVPLRWVVKKDKLFGFLKQLKNRYDIVIIRPASSKYYDGKFILCLNDVLFACDNCGYKIISNSFINRCPKCNTKLTIDKIEKKDKKLKPLQVFPPLKATGSAYHDIEYFNVDDAWQYFGKYGVETEGKIRADLKIDGWRCVLSQDKNGKTLIYFEDSKKNVAEKFPNVVKELSDLNENGIIFDSELMELSPNKKVWLSRHDLMRWSQAKDPGSDENVRIFVFDILYYNGKDLHNLPLSERIKILNEVAKKFKKHFILVSSYDIKTKEQLEKLFKYYENNVDKLKLGRLHGIDGFMLKYYSGTYELDGNTLTWCKLKYALELDTIVLEKIKNRAGNYNYIVGYGIPQDKKDKFTPVKELNGKYYGVLGKTFNTKIEANVGQILNIAAAEYKKEIVDGKIKYTLFQARVLTLKPDKKEPDSYLIVDKLSVSKTKTFYDFYILSDKENITGQWTIEEGMVGKYCVQCHTRGIRPIFIDELTLSDIKKYGLDREYFIPTNDEIKAIHNLYKDITITEWKKAISEAKSPNKSSKNLTKLINKLLKNIDYKSLPDNMRKLIALLDPVSIHQDLRLVPEGADYFEGGHWTTPGNQFKENRLLKVNEHIHLQFMLKTPHVSEIGDKTPKEPVVRGPASWLTVGDGKPLIVPPDSIGSTSNNYASFWVHEKGTWYAGRQTSPHGKHFKLFKFKGKLFDGWYIFMYAPINGKRIWLFYKPKNQEVYEEKNKRDKQFLIDVEYIYKLLYAINFKF